MSEKIHNVLMISEGWARYLPHCFLEILFRQLIDVGHFGYRSLGKRYVTVLVWNSQVLCASYTDTVKSCVLHTLIHTKAKVDRWIRIFKKVTIFQRRAFVSYEINLSELINLPSFQLSCCCNYVKRKLSSPPVFPNCIWVIF